MAFPNQIGAGQPQMQMPKLGVPGFPVKPGLPFPGKAPVFNPGAQNPLQQGAAPGFGMPLLNPVSKFGLPMNPINPGVVQPPNFQAGVPGLQSGMPGNNPGPNLQPMFPMQPQFPKLGPQPGNLGIQPPNQIPLSKFGPGGNLPPFVPANGQRPSPFSSYESGRVQVSGSLGNSLPKLPAVPALNPNVCPFCKTKPIQAKTPCGHDYCSVICMQAYIKNRYDGFNFDNIPCIICQVPFQVQFLHITFGSEDEMRRILREHIEQKLKRDVCPGDEGMFNELTDYHPMPPFYCPICKQNKPHNERWDLACGHVQCGPCLAQRITNSVLVLKSYANVTCAECPQEIPYVNVWCLVPKEVRVAYEAIVPLTVIVDDEQGLIRYDCPIHPFFIIYIDANRPWIKCDICNIRYCTRCPHWTPHKAPGCPHARGLAPPSLV